MSENETTTTRPSPVARLLKAHLATILLVILVAIFLAQNTSRTGIHFLWLSFHSSLWFVLLLTTVVGFLIGVLAARRMARRSSP